MSMIRTLIIPLACATAVCLTGCGGSESEGTVKVAAELKTVQCDPAYGERVSALRQSLESRGIVVMKTTCGALNLNSSAICGIPDGRIAFFEIGQSRVAEAKGLGFFVAAERPRAVDYGSCPEPR